MSEVNDHQKVTLSGEDFLSAILTAVSEKQEELWRAFKAESDKAAEAAKESARKTKMSYDDMFSEIISSAQGSFSAVRTVIGMIGGLYDAAHEMATKRSVVYDLREQVKAAGQDVNEVVAQMREATGGAIDEQGLLKAKNLMSSFGIGYADSLALMEVATKASIKTGQDMQYMLDSITTAVARGSSKVLDNIGIIVTQKEANIEYAESIGKTADALTEAEQKSAFMQATIKRGNEVFASVDVNASYSLSLKAIEVAAEEAKGKLFDFLSVGDNMIEVIRTNNKETNELVDAYSKLIKLLADIGSIEYLNTHKGVQEFITNSVALERKERGRNLEYINKAVNGVQDVLDREENIVFLQGVSNRLAKERAEWVSSWGTDDVPLYGDKANKPKKKPGRGGGRSKADIEREMFGPLAGARASHAWENQLSDAAKAEGDYWKTVADMEVARLEWEKSVEWARTGMLKNAQRDREIIVEENLALQWAAFEKSQEDQKERDKIETENRRTAVATMGVELGRLGVIAAGPAEMFADSMNKAYEATGPDRAAHAIKGVAALTTGIGQQFVRWAGWQIIRETSLGLATIFTAPWESVTHFASAAVAAVMAGKSIVSGGSGGGGRGSRSTHTDLSRPAQSVGNGSKGSTQVTYIVNIRDSLIDSPDIGRKIAKSLNAAAETHGAKLDGALLN